MIIHLKVGLIKKILLYKMNYNPPCGHRTNEKKIELDLSNYTTKSDLKNTISVDISDFAKNTDLASLKSDIDKLNVDKLNNIQSGLDSLKNKVYKLDVDRLKPVLVDLKQLSDVVDNDVLKKTVYNELVKTLMPLILAN